MAKQTSDLYYDVCSVERKIRDLYESLGMYYRKGGTVKTILSTVEMSYLCTYNEAELNTDATCYEFTANRGAPRTCSYRSRYARSFDVLIVSLRFQYVP